MSAAAEETMERDTPLYVTLDVGQGWVRGAVVVCSCKRERQQPPRFLFVPIYDGSCV